MNILDKLTVLATRFITPKEKLAAMNGKELLIYSINEGMVSKEQVKNASIGVVTVSDNTAKGQFVTGGKESDIYFSFYKEEDKWKLDLTSIFPRTIAPFKDMISQSGYPENIYLGMLLNSSMNKAPKNNIWQPVK